MTKKMVSFACCLFLLTGICSAETIYLKSGKKIQGQISERDAKKIKVSVSGINMTYYLDEIERIEMGVSAPAESKPQAKPIEILRPVSSTPSMPMVNSPAAPSQPQGKSQAQSQISDVSVSVSTAPAVSKRELILNYIEVTGEKQNMRQRLDQTMSQVPAADREKIKSLFNVDEIIEQIIPIYDKYFTEEDLATLIGFYKSPLYRKLAMIMPMMREDIVDAIGKYVEKKTETLGEFSPGQANNPAVDKKTP
ncbi:MAG TPA: DUF2059 domain-containing protein [Candidatus Omnitrophota bacterium]|nr:DUF2059 domain-containing protein [Candidatus Omnitrophota bacterium]HPD84360.1 DUF2059 domain-containing protein [Candidatus Omnitrophota bacterium]HRZ03218.1 DUF2059 domain-containing protein [Candidatus Omnitrophota bacterium]